MCSWETPPAFFAAPASKLRSPVLCAEHPDATIVPASTDVGMWVTKGMAALAQVIWLAVSRARRP
jgi:xanthine dehydrogenase iron-sulfur cluster and FAD-binding subunit A